MANTITYQTTTWSDSEIKNGTLHMEIGLYSDSLAMDTLTVELQSDTDLRNFFAAGVPMTLSRSETVVGQFFNPTVRQIAVNKYRVEAYSWVVLLDKDFHAGGIYSNATVSSMVSSIMGSVSYQIDSDLAAVQLSGWLPYATRRENLQQVLFAAGANVQRTATGTPRFALLDTTVKSNIDADRAFYGGSVDTDQAVTRVEITEHRYAQGTETKTLFNDTISSTERIVFDEPMHSLAVSGGTIVESGANYARVSGTSGIVTLTGKTYTHTARMVSSGTATDRVVSIQNATLAGPINAALLADRLLGYTQYNERITQDFLWSGERPGDTVVVSHPYASAVQAVIESVDVTLSGKLRAKGVFRAGFVPTAKVPAYANHQVLTASGSWTVPAGVTRIKLTLVGGGNGGGGGGNGNKCNFQPSGSLMLISPSAGGSGGQGGTGGGSGAVYVQDLTVTPGDVINFSPGSGGAGGAVGSSGVLGTKTTAIVRGVTYSTDNGSLYDNGYHDDLTGLVLAKKGASGNPGGSGGNGGRTSADIMNGTAGNGSSGGDGGAGHIETYTYYVGSSPMSGTAIAGGGGGGGASGDGQRGSNGLPGQKIPGTLGTEDYDFVGGAGGVGASATSAGVVGATPGSGGGGGHGGGGNGGLGGARVDGYQYINMYTAYTTRPDAVASGSAGGNGANGCVIIYY